MDELIKKLKEDIKYCKDCEMPLDWVSFATGIGVLISANEAQRIVDALEAQENKPSIKPTRPETLTITIKNPNSGHPLLDEIRKYGYNIPDEKTIAVKPIIIDCESLDNTLSQHEEVEGYEFVNGVGDCDDCAKCEFNDPHYFTFNCPKNCTGYYKRKTE